MDRVFVWFESIHSEMCIADAARRGRKGPVSSALGKDRLETVPLSFNSVSEPSPGTQATHTYPKVCVTSNHGTGEIANDTGSSPKRARREKDNPHVNKTLHASSGQMTNRTNMDPPSPYTQFKKIDRCTRKVRFCFP